MKKEFERALELLKRAKAAIDDELDAAGSEEVRQHPVLLGHARVSDAIQVFLHEHKT